MFRVVLATAILGAVTMHAEAKVSPGQSPYIQTGPDGTFYARCIPDGATAATTKIYKVGRDDDTLLDTYDWYAPRGVTLAWSPTGKVAVMAMGGKAVAGTPPVVLSFHLGGKQLASYTVQDLGKLGLDVTRLSTDGSRNISVIGCEQIEWTNDYVFVIEGKDKKRLAFDILTGKVRTK